MRFLLLVSIFFCVAGYTLEAQTGYTKTKSGLPYKIIKQGTGKAYPETGGFITFHFQIRTDKDSILDNQFQDPNPIGIPTPEITHRPSIEEGFWLLREGDSAVFMLNADSLYANSFRTKTPDFIKPGSTVKMIIRMATVYSKPFVDSVMAAQEKQNGQAAANEYAVYEKDSIAIQNYLRTNHLTGVATPSGTYVVFLKKNTIGSFITSGEAVKAGYVGKLLVGGQVFDQSQPGSPFTFTVGVGHVIKGWDEGFLKLKHGEKALLLIPSRNAYGSQGAGNAIPPNAPLLFEVEVF